MDSDQSPRELFVDIGGVRFAERDVRLKTVLGSCVSFTFWHPQRYVGGMCHFAMPSRQRQRDGALDGRFADEAMQLLLKAALQRQTRLEEYLVGMYGGGCMFPDIVPPDSHHVGVQNIHKGRELIKQYHLNCIREHVGGIGSRNVIFDIASGEVQVRMGAFVEKDGK